MVQWDGASSFTLLGVSLLLKWFPSKASNSALTVVLNPHFVSLLQNPTMRATKRTICRAVYKNFDFAIR